MKNRITILFSSIIVIVTLVSGIFSYTIFKEAYYTSAEENLRSNSQYIVERLMPIYLKDFDEESLNDYADATGQRISIIDIRGNVIYETYTGIGVMDNHLSRPEVKAALNGESTAAARYSQTIQKNMLYFAAPYYTNDTITAVVRLSMPLDVLTNVSYDIINNLIFVALASIMVAIVLFTVLLNREMQPLDDACGFAHRIARGDYKTMMNRSRDEKICVLVESLNQMAEQLEASFEKINRKNLELSSVLGSMNQGIIAVDARRNIIFINDSACKIFKTASGATHKGESLLTICREKVICELPDLISSYSDDAVCEEMMLDGKEYKVTASAMQRTKESEYGGVLILLQDITKIRGLEKIRRDFVSNVSHELKTPITTIRGFIETIQENNITDTVTLNRFYDIIASESLRLSRLVGDILVLSHLENNQRTQEASILELSVISEIRQVFDLVSMSAEEKGLSLSVVGDDSITIEINPDDIRQLLLNLIDNAVKYNRQNGRVDVVVEDADRQVRITIKDTGAGIPEADIPRIFERFYRVDKSRSREIGGTGLGLAIVKHIVQNNQGQIEVTSRVGEGTCFEVNLRKKADK